MQQCTRIVGLSVRIYTRVKIGDLILIYISVEKCIKFSDKHNKNCTVIAPKKPHFFFLQTYSGTYSLGIGRFTVHRALLNLVNICTFVHSLWGRCATFRNYKKNVILNFNIVLFLVLYKQNISMKNENKPETFSVFFF